MDSKFKVLGIVGKPRQPEAIATHAMLYSWLQASGYQVLVEESVAADLSIPTCNTASLDEIGRMADLALVIGGDGNMLGAARVLSNYPVKVIGVNRGNLGFLTDLDPETVPEQLAAVLAGEYIAETRFLLEAQLLSANGQCRQSTAMNEIVLHAAKVAHMMEFEVYIDEKFAFSQRSDGLIITTPTGSTAYSLSAGGPILTPGLNAIALVPMFPHTLAARPLVIDSTSKIKLCFPSVRSELAVSYDSQLTFELQQDDQLLIQRSPNQLNLIHPKEYSYFNTLSNKLGWSGKFY
jgi:NAD+ kinase